MAKKPINWRLWSKMIVTGGVVCVGGPAFTLWLTPTDEELFKKYNPELQKRSLEGRYERQKEFDDFVTNLKKYSKSDKPIWVVQKEEEKKAGEAKQVEAAKLKSSNLDLVKEEMRKEAGLSK